jgi:hypothetical protein
VPAAYGWLALDRRGNWSIKGERIANRTVIAFIGRNYGCDPRGRWFFQNGPQRVYVSLAYTPFVARTEPSADGLQVRTHTGTEFVPGSAWLDDAGNLLVGVDDTVAVIHDQDLGEALGCLRRGCGAPLTDTELEEVLIGNPLPGDVVLALGGVARPVARLEAAAVARRFAFEPNPRPDPGEPEC